MNIRVFDGIQARWSPDSTRFAFARMGDSGKIKDALCVMSVDGTNLRTIAYWGLDPKWSPDGGKILCSWSGRLTLVDPNESYIDDDRKLQHLSRHSVLMGDFDWSPDGRMIAFIERTIEGQSHLSGLYVINVDGTNLRCLIKDDKDRHHLSWSSDGRWIVCGSRGIELLSVTNGSHRVLFPHGIYPSWSPIGDKKHSTHIAVFTAEMSSQLCRMAFISLIMVLINLKR